MLHKTLEWDSDFFGFRIDRIFCDSSSRVDELSQKINSLKITDCQLAYIEIDGGCEFAYNNIDLGLLVDRKVIYRKDLSARTEKDEHIRSIREASPELYSLAFQAGHESRYKKDKRFESGEFERLYKTWVDNSINGCIADTVLGYYIEDRLVGFVTLAFREKFSDIGLIAVQNGFRGRNVGKKLIEAVERVTLAHGLMQVCVATQRANAGACAFYEKCGFEIISSTSIYHKWFH